MKSSLKFLLNLSFIVISVSLILRASSLISAFYFHSFNTPDSKDLYKSHLEMKRCTEIMPAFNSSRDQFIFSCKGRKAIYFILLIMEKISALQMPGKKIAVFRLSQGFNSWLYTNGECGSTTGLLGLWKSPQDR